MIKKRILSIDDQINNILMDKFPGLTCPQCGKAEIYAGMVEIKYFEEANESTVISFDVFCRSCGGFIGKWDKTNRMYWFR